MSRYPQSTDLRRWLCTIPNHYLHFGDFDLAGIGIFLFEFQQYLGAERSSFLIPSDIDSFEVRFRKRYDEQYCRFKDIKSDESDLQQLMIVSIMNEKVMTKKDILCLNIDIAPSSFIRFKKCNKSDLFA